MKTYIKFLLNVFFISFCKVFFIFFGIILIINILEQVEFFKDTDINYFYLTFVSFLNTPSVLFEIFPFIFLISTQIFFIKLIDSNELEIFKYSGLNNTNIIKIVGSFTILFTTFLVFFFYNFSSLLKNNYLEIKNKYTNDNKYLAVINENGLWIKDIVDKKINIITANKIYNEFLLDTLITQFDEDYNHIKTIESYKVDISSNRWKLLNPYISEKNVTTNSEIMYLTSNFDLKKINGLFSNLSSLTIFQLFKLRKSYQSLNYSLVEIDAHFYRIASYPLYLTLITILISIIMLNISYQKNSLFKIIFGIFLSVIIYYINYFFNVLGTTEKIPLILSIFFPLIILLIINSTFILRINEK